VTNILHCGMSQRQCSIPSTPMSKLPEFSFSNHIRWQHFVAGLSGGVLSTLVVHPLDLIKIRFQGVFIISSKLFCLYV